MRTILKLRLKPGVVLKHDVESRRQKLCQLGVFSGDLHGDKRGDDPLIVYRAYRCGITLEDGSTCDAHYLLGLATICIARHHGLCID